MTLGPVELGVVVLALASLSLAVIALLNGRPKR
jgi:hypothetical protein